MLHVDPAFDMFRRLDARETPPSLGQLFGDAAPLVVIAAERGSGPRRGIPGHGGELEGAGARAEGRARHRVTSLPTDRSVWLFGRGNRFAKDLVDGTAVRLDAGTVTIDAQAMPLRDHAAILVRRHPGDVTRAIGWIVADRVDAMEGLGRKLPHYGKYSYLGFEGAEPVNMLKGQWQASDSPLSVDLRAGTRRDTAIAPLTLARAPLADAARRLLGDVTEGARDDAGVARSIRAAASAPPASTRPRRTSPHSSRPPASRPACPAGRIARNSPRRRRRTASRRHWRNIVGVLQGSDPAWSDQSVVVTAHYDHLGMGWPEPAGR